MSSTALTVLALAGLLTISFAMLITLTEGLRRHRIGVTLLACWATLALMLFILRAIGQPLPHSLYASWLWPVGVLCGTWALWDVSRISRLYGTSTLMSAAEIARGFLHSPKASESIWSAWIHGLPSAAWLKSPDGVMVAINRHYEHTYGKPATAYTGAPDKAVWPDGVAAAFAENDRDVYRLGAPIVVREPTPTWDNPKHRGLILKFPVRNTRGEIVGVGGIELIHPTGNDAHERGNQ